MPADIVGINGGEGSHKLTSEYVGRSQRCAGE
jgi:hypothetical protein